MKTKFLFLIAMTLIFAGCAQDQADPEAPARAIETYLTARISKDSEAFQGTYCADFEFEALTEFDSFGAVEATIEEMVCTVDSVLEGSATVTCTGGVEVVYEGENSNTIDLGRLPYTAALEDGEWKMCGYVGW